MLLPLLQELSEYRKIRDSLSSPGWSLVYGTSPVHRSFLAAGISESGACPVVIARDEESARSLMEDYIAFGGGSACFLPTREFIFHNIDNVSREYEQQRIAALHRYMKGGSALFTTPEALMCMTMPPEAIEKTVFSIDSDGEYDLEKLALTLTDAGYIRTESVEGPGQFALRGGILDVFPAGSVHPARIEFFGDFVDSISYFDTVTQRRISPAVLVEILPTREALPGLAPGGISGLCALLRKKAAKASEQLRKTLEADAEMLEAVGLIAASDRYLQDIYGFHTALEYISPDSPVLLCDSQACFEAAKAYEFRCSEDIVALLENGVISSSQKGISVSASDLKNSLSGARGLMLDSFMGTTPIPPSEILSFNSRTVSPYGGGAENAADEIEEFLGLGYTVYVLAGGGHRAQNMIRLLTDRSLSCTSDEEKAGPRTVCVLADAISTGFELPDRKVVVFTEGRGSRKAASKPKKRKKNHLNSYTDLTPGDLVVHDHHGIGRFVGVERIVVDKVWKDYIKIAYAGSDYVYVPATNLDLVSKYIGAGEQTEVSLTKLGGASWAKAKTKAKKAAVDLAESLARLYAARKEKPGFAFPPDDDWQLSFEEAFPYEETEDQLSCAQEIKHDMEQTFSMDRLLCGDVGFGKTEVAFRAIMKCILAGKQAAVLVPTTVLCSQHYLTAMERFSGYPIRVEMLSRYRSPNQAKDILRRLATGEIDIIVGTHKLLQKDVHFKDLGLLVVDEEQRFGVTHKEAIKKIATSVDVLTLTATPIPRTLNMALTGIRDMSVLEEPPRGRRPVQTYVLEHDNIVINDAIRRELARGGQVYYLHNRIESIDTIAGGLQKAFPDAVIATAHGRMNEERFSDVMARTYSGEIQILVCTTIIETGVDIPNVNTLIIEDADRFGLAQLHQIRGRVGRSNRHAYAYFTYRRGKVLSEIAQKRLTAIREFAEFGSGFKIAMRDLEIRGAGNVLGAEQSGHMVSVGYEMYLRLLSEAASEIKGEAPERKVNCTADFLLSAGLPQNYITDPGTRVDLYRRIALINSEEEWLDMRDELLDRFGDIPKAGLALLDIALLRANASKCGIDEITQKAGSIMFYFHPTELRRASAVCALPAYKGKMLLSPGDRSYITLRIRPDDDPLKSAADAVKAFSEAEA